MPIGCLISLDNNPQGVYYAGQELSGVVDLTVDAKKRIKSIHITVSGYAKIRWIKKGYPRDSERATCRAYRPYLSSRSYVLGTHASNSIIDWNAGEYSYTFHVRLPKNLPTSFDGKFGQVHYEIITAIDRPNRRSKVFKLPFTVIHPLDLNSDAVFKVPLEILGRKRFWSFCCPTGPLTMKFSTPYCGYAPGQKIHFVLYINNESSIDITECEVKLKQEVIYESNEPQHEYRYDKHLIANRQFGNVLRWSRKVYRGFLKLHSIPPSSLKISCPININYVIKVIIKPTDFHMKLKWKIPLTVGTIPIMDSPMNGLHDTLLRMHRSPFHSSNLVNERPPQPRTPQHLPAPREMPDNLSAPAILITDVDNPPDYILLMPPSYEDAMALSEQFCDDIPQNISMSSIATTNRKDEPYKPRYPVYYGCETPTIPPEMLYDDSPSQLRVTLQPAEMLDNAQVQIEYLHCGKK